MTRKLLVLKLAVVCLAAVVGIASARAGEEQARPEATLPNLMGINNVRRLIGTRSELKVTDEQRTQIIAIAQKHQKAMEAEVAAILTPEQQAKMAELLAQPQEGRGRRRGPDLFGQGSALNLTAEQTTQIEAMLNKHRDALKVEIRAILTAEQQAVMDKQWERQRRNRNAGAEQPQ